MGQCYGQRSEERIECTDGDDLSEARRENKSVAWVEQSRTEVFVWSGGLSESFGVYSNGTTRNTLVSSSARLGRYNMVLRRELELGRTEVVAGRH